MENKNLGCGKPYYDEESGEGTFCNEFNGLCPACSKSEEDEEYQCERWRLDSDNKSPQEDSVVNADSSSVKRTGDTSNLSDERVKLFKYLREQFGESSLIPDDILRIVQRGDKTFIKKDMLLICKFLNKDISEKEFWDERDKLTGRKLVE